MAAIGKVVFLLEIEHCAQALELPTGWPLESSTISKKWMCVLKS